MAGFDFSFKALQKGFFDASKIQSAVEKAEAKVAAKFGAFVRRRMQTSLRYKKGTAAPGVVPFAHRSESFTRPKLDRKAGVTTRQPSSPLRDLIFFAITGGSGVVIGPVLFGAGGAGALEKGGRTTRKNRKGERVPITIAPHPFARPAGEAEAQKVPDLLKRMVN